jgi:anti-anti-sigma factor
MTIDRSIQEEARGKAKRTRATRLPVEQQGEAVSLDVERSGDWMPAEELREAALAALGQNRNVAADLGRLDHLDASALQILLALAAGLKSQGRRLELNNASAHLRQWFDYAGAADHFSMGGPVPHE